MGGWVQSLLLESYEERSRDLAENARYKVLSETGPALVRECLHTMSPDREDTLRTSLRQAFYSEDVVAFGPDGEVMFTTGDRDPDAALEDPGQNRWLPVVVRGSDDEILASLVLLDRTPLSEVSGSSRFLEDLRRFTTGELDNSFHRFLFLASVIAAVTSMVAVLFLVRWADAFRRVRRAASRGRKLRETRRELESRLEQARASLAETVSPEKRTELEDKVRSLRMGIDVATDRALRNEAYRAVLDGSDLRGRIEAEVRLSGHCTFNAMILGREMEVLVRQRLKDADVKSTGATMFSRLRALQQRAGISDDDFDRLQRAWKVRNRIIHNQHRCQRDEGLLMVRSLRILGALSSEEIRPQF
ncbi:MAG: hypothetical protein ACYTG4_09495 [Planctomycetota bacterium]